jgi:hypothetical protein
MKTSSLAGSALAITTGAALLAACGSAGGSSLAPSGPSTGMAGFGLIGSAVMLNGLRAHQGGVFSPDKKTTGPYVYISDVLDDAVYQFDFPGYDWVGSITGIAYPKGECTRTGKRTFWVTASGSDEIEEFAIGGTSPIKTLSESAGTPVSCAIDPASGNLAATIGTNGDVILYNNASGSGTVLTTPLEEADFDGYDNAGNLFVDGLNGGAFALVELPNGSSAFQTIATSNTVEWPGGVQWDGKYVTVYDTDAHAIYRYTVSGTTATLEGTVSLRGPRASECGQDAITTHFVYCPQPGLGEVHVYKYPAGGRAVTFLRRSFNSPAGSVKLVK